MNARFLFCLVLVTASAFIPNGMSGSNTGEDNPTVTHHKPPSPEDKSFKSKMEAPLSSSALGPAPHLEPLTPLPKQARSVVVVDNITIINGQSLRFNCPPGQTKNSSMSKEQAGWVTWFWGKNRLDKVGLKLPNLSPLLLCHQPKVSTDPATGQLVLSYANEHMKGRYECYRYGDQRFWRFYLHVNQEGWTCVPSLIRVSVLTLIVILLLTCLCCVLNYVRYLFCLRREE